MMTIFLILLLSEIALAHEGHIHPEEMLAESNAFSLTGHIIMTIISALIVIVGGLFIFYLHSKEPNTKEHHSKK